MTGGSTRRAAVGLLALGFALAPVRAARALEAFDGRIQVHGFVEEQVRVLDGSFNEEADLAQWYNVLTLENEFDIAPNGFGPIDLLQAYTRIEVRYDCIYTHGCGMFQSVNTYGNDAKRLPQRLRDAKDQDYGGVIPTGTSLVPQEVPRVQNERPQNWAILTVVPNQLIGGATPTPDEALFNGTWIKNTSGLGPGFQPSDPHGTGPWNREVITIVQDRQGFPGFDTLFKTRGADAELGTNQDTGINDDPANYTFAPVIDYLWTFRSKKGPDGGAGRTMVMGPWLPKNFIRTLGTLSDRANPFRGITPPTRNGLSLAVAPGGVQNRRVPDPRTAQFPAPLSGAPYPTTDPNGDILDSRIVSFFLDPINGYNQMAGLFPAIELNIANAPIDGTGFGGDFSGIVPSVTPEVLFESRAQKAIRGDEVPPLSGTFPGTNVKAVGGTTELPARPAPDQGNLAPFDQQVAQGLYLPSSNLRRALREQDFDDHEFNFTESERAWNHGQSQQDTYELKEAYVDVEVLDSRLWARLGLQNIVWGKTELFRTTDQFNPQDLALASLASLEESRIALFAGRFVYSLYDVGPLEDVRAEFAFNFDDYQPADLGACGEAFTPDVVCGLTAGLFFHGLTGIGIVGIDRPPDPWDSIKGLEIGGRLEWRWDRFSFALMDFWGYSDFPFPDAINYYERNVDPDTGRPRIAGATGRCFTAGAFLAPDGSPGTPLPGTLGIPAGFSARSLADPQVPQGMQGGLGMGVDPDCLKAGGAPGGVNANRWQSSDYTALRAWYADPINNPFPVLYDGLGESPQNALENQSANQQIFAWICSGTVTIAAAVDPGACAWSIFTTGAPLNAAAPFLPLSEVLGALFAGEHSETAQGYFNTFTVQTKLETTEFTPVRNLNHDFNDGIITALNPEINSPDQIFGIPFNDFLTLDSTLTNEQRALIGCGPFFGTRCDSGRGGQAVNTVVPGAPIINYQGAGWAIGGGMDVLNAEGSAILQAFPGFEGTADVGLNGLTAGTPWTTTNRDLKQPGTIGFEGGPVCTRNVGGQLVVLPGCRGVQSLELEAGGASYRAVFDNGYQVSQDGCIFGIEAAGTGFGTNQAVSLNGKPINAVRADGSAVDLSTCGSGPAFAQTTEFSHTRDAIPGNNGYGRPGGAPNLTTYLSGARTLFHPLAGCLTAAQAATATPCVFQNRDFNAEFGAGTAQIFRNELAAFSWNLMMFLITAGSCDIDERSIKLDPECFDPDNPWQTDKCGFAAPQYCGSVKGFLGVGGPNRNVVEAGGNARFGRRDFIWHSGGELALRYAKRNVFGLSTDFAEDVSKTNWSLEFTWIGATPYLDADDFENGITDSDSLNLTISVDRPTFINFLNANRTFFFNSQWFFQYLTGYESSFATNGPFNVLFTFAMFTGYYQDRLLPTLVTVYDFNSRSGGFLPSITYRFNEAFSITTGVNLFWGRGQYKDMPVRAFAPTSNRAGKHAYDDGVENVLSAINRRDEIFLRLRYTF